MADYKTRSRAMAAEGITMEEIEKAKKKEKSFAKKAVAKKMKVGSDEHYKEWKKKVSGKSALSKAIGSLAKRKSNEA